MAVGSVTFLSQEFLNQEKYRQRPKNAGTLFEVTFLRTYSKWVPELKRRETWGEVIRRVVEYSLSLYSGSASHEELIREAELMYDKIYSLEVLPAGRTLWVGGTTAVKKHGLSNYNCAYLNVEKPTYPGLKSFNSFGDIFYLLLCGCGVGYGVQKEMVDTLPKLHTDFEIAHREYIPLSKNQRSDETLTYTNEEGNYIISIGDSKEAWVKALMDYFSILEDGKEPIQIEFDYNNVRPAGERLKTFGGRAAGPKGLEIMFTKLSKVIKSVNGKLTPLSAIDISNMIAENVLVGGTRRSAQIALGSPGDEEFKNAKLSLYIHKDGKWVLDPERSHRRMSNNSIIYDKKPSLIELLSVFKNIMNNGEPGLFNRETARLKRPRSFGTNPCGETNLDNFGVCNLSLVVLYSHLTKEGNLDLEKLEESFKLATRIGLRQTNVEIGLPHWNEVQKRDRLTGVSMTGLMKTLDTLKLSHKDNKVKQLLSWFRTLANTEATNYAKEMGVPRPLLVTALKPEGTSTLLTTSISPGLHRSFAPYYIRRISISELDPICKALQFLGVPNEPKLESDNKDGTRRILFSFPVASGAKISADDESSLDQFDRYLTMQECYTDHNSSCTLYMGRKEWKKVAKKVYDNWDSIIACAFLPKNEAVPFTLKDKILDFLGLFKTKARPYPQMPYETISKDKYDEMIKTFPDLTCLGDILTIYEQEEAEEDELDNADCSASGSCPVR